MSYQNISAQLSAEDVQTIKGALATIKSKLPFLINLTTEERKKTFKIGPNSLSFVQNSLTAAKNNPAILPASFGVEEFESDVNLFAVLTEVNTAVEQLASQIDDTRVAVGGEAMNEANQVYSYVKSAAKITPGLKPVADQLGERFQKSGSGNGEAKAATAVK